MAIYRGNTWIWQFLCGLNFCKYFQFFTAGILCAKYHDLFIRLLSSHRFYNVALIGWIVGMATTSFPIFQPFHGIVYNFVPDILTRYCALSTVVILFYKHRDYFDRGGVLISNLTRIGRRTLEIYMLHYFFQSTLNDLHGFLDDGNKFIFQFTVCGLITAVVIVLCLAVSGILHRSTIVNRYVFGSR